MLCRKVIEITSEKLNSARQTGCVIRKGEINKLEVDWEEQEVLIKPTLI